MDHIPLPLHPIRERFKVPLLGNQVYDNPGDFLRYPEHQGWTPRPRWQWKALFQNPPAEFQAFLQRWLCFGVLDAVLDRPINIQDFAQQDSDNEYYFSTRRLVDFTDQSFRDAGMLQVLDAMFLVSNTASSELGSYSLFVDPLDDYRMQSLEDVIRRGEMPMLLDPRVAVGMITVVEFLYGFGISRAALIDRNTPQSGFHDVHGPSTGRSLIALPLRSTIWRLMREEGWCPYQLSLMFSRFNMSGLLFMLHIERPEPLKKHNVIRVRRRNDDEKGHKSQDRQELCALYGCGHRMLQNSTYTTKHCSECPGCRNVSPDIAELSGILMGGSFPLILSIDEREDPERICLVPWDEDISYIAISHVWSDGLGNVQDNSLPLCQLRRLSKMVRELSGKASNVVLFWLDTVCVPRFNGPKSHEKKAIRTKALSEMRKTYECSTATLVLDSWLLSVAGKGMSEAEILMRVFSCHWNSRLWTYQEGALPSAVYFQLEDIACDIDALVAEFKRSMDSGLEHTLGQRLIRQHNALRGFRDHRGQTSLELFSIIGAMSHRTTTIATDEAICLSTLLDLDTAKIVNTEPGARMKELWRMLPEVPDVVVLHTGPKVDAPGLGWAPRSFLLTRDSVSPRTGQLYTAEGSAFSHSFKVTRHGLLIKARAMVIHCGLLRLSETIHFKDQHGLWYYMHSAFNDNVATLDYWGPDLKSIEPHRFYGGTKVALLFDDLYSKAPIGPVTDAGETGIIVIVIPGAHHGGLRLGKEVGTARLTRLNSTQHRNNLKALQKKYPFTYSEHWENPPYATESKFETTLAVTMAEKVEAEADWCLV